MVKLINKTTKTPMWVADNRVKEYMEAGHKPASGFHTKKPVEELKVEQEEKTGDKYFRKTSKNEVI